MATYYVDSSATAGAQNGTSKTDAYLSVDAAVAGSAAAGDTLLCSHTHDEATVRGTVTITYVGPAGSEESPLQVISINFSDDSYTYGARIGNTGNGGAQVYFEDGWALHGIHVTTAAFLQALVANQSLFMYDCRVQLLGTNVSQSIRLGQNQTRYMFKDCDFVFGSTGQRIELFNNSPFVRFENCSIHSTSAAITRLFSTEQGGTLEISGLDCTNADTTAFEVFGMTDIDQGLKAQIAGIVLPTNGSIGDFTFSDVGRPGAYVLATGINDATDGVFYRSGSGDIVDSTTVYRDATTDGTTGYSLKFDTDANTIPGALQQGGALSFDIATFYADANPTITVQAFGDHATILTDQEFWFEVDYPTSTGMRNSSSTVYANLLSGTGSSVTATGSAADWTGESGANQRFYNPSLTVSGGAAGVHRVRVYLARPSETLYIDPKVDIA
jgi:hypothetical protein